MDAGDAGGGVETERPTYHSTYEGGLSTAKYALFVMRGDGHVDVVPVGDHAWFSINRRWLAVGAMLSPMRMRSIRH